MDHKVTPTCALALSIWMMTSFAHDIFSQIAGVTFTVSFFLKTSAATLYLMLALRFLDLRE